MAEPIIHVRNLWKRYYQVGHRPSLRHEASQLLSRWLFARQAADPFHDNPFWALQAVTFEVNQGECVGVIGRNGSGKTTLLRLLSGITLPTIGTVRVRGHFATLIGLGAGFDIQRTGRENIYLNGAIFGVHPREMQKLLTTIIEFSELEAFIDQPVKHYSSGMVARLGFSIAVHILPDIIFIDEALAVGDIEFQAKCMRKIYELRERQCTIILVSHSEKTIIDVCDRCLWLDNGKVVMIDRSAAVMQAYKEPDFRP